MRVQAEYNTPLPIMEAMELVGEPIHPQAVEFLSLALGDDERLTSLSQQHAEELANSLFTVRREVVVDWTDNEDYHDAFLSDEESARQFVRGQTMPHPEDGYPSVVDAHRVGNNLRIINGRVFEGKLADLLLGGVKADTVNAAEDDLAAKPLHPQALEFLSEVLGADERLQPLSQAGALTLAEKLFDIRHADIVDMSEALQARLLTGIETARRYVQGEQIGEPNGVSHPRSTKDVTNNIRGLAYRLADIAKETYDGKLLDLLLAQSDIGNVRETVIVAVDQDTQLAEVEPGDDESTAVVDNQQLIETPQVIPVDEATVPERMTPLVTDVSVNHAHRSLGPLH